MLRGIQYNIMDKKGTKRMGITIKLEKVFIEPAQ